MIVCWEITFCGQIFYVGGKKVILNTQSFF